MFAIAVNRKFVNKVPFPAPENVWNQFNGNFTNEYLSAPDLVACIQQGFAYTTHHRRYRKAENFILGQHLALDFDTKDERSSLSSLANHPFISTHATFLYTTPSHTIEHPKARAVFLLDRPIRDRDKYTMLSHALVEVIPFADQTCKDATRLFYGSKDCEVLTLGNVLTLEEAGEVIVKPYRERVEREEAKRLAEREAMKQRYGEIYANDDSKANYINRIFEKAEEKVRLAGPGERHHTLLKQTRHLAGFLNASWVPLGLVNESRIKEAMMSASIANGEVKDYGAENSETTIRDGIQYGKTKPYEEPVWRISQRGQVVAATSEPELLLSEEPDPAVVPIPMPTYSTQMWGKLFTAYQQIQNQLLPAPSIITPVGD